MKRFLLALMWTFAPLAVIFLSVQSNVSATEKKKVIVSYAYDWGASTDMVTLLSVPKGYWFVATDVCGYWWGKGPAQRVTLYEGVNLKGVFLASGRGYGAQSFSPFNSCFSSTQSGIVFRPGTEVRAMPSTTYVTVTIAGYLIRVESASD